MASTVFTFDHNPPKVSSPWPNLRPGRAYPKDITLAELHYDKSAARLEDYGIKKLQPEPQEGPVEYKLHLLLRPRNKTVEPRNHISTPASTQAGLPAAVLAPERPMTALPGSVVAAHSSQPRQERLLHLTTQLLWRLQQSSPLHSAAQSQPGISALAAKPDDDTGLFRPDRAVPCLEQSQGALYEIGVSDDGALEGLAEQEMQESLLTLQFMAASLGCHVVIHRLIAVSESDVRPGGEENKRDVSPTQAQTLWVVEAFVSPGALSYGPSERASSDVSALRNPEQRLPGSHLAPLGAFDGNGKIDQLRVSLTGSTTSGKSSLLGTLSTSTLDNGRGKSRLRYGSSCFLWCIDKCKLISFYSSLLKHRHEISSGVTSSIVTEIVGYSDNHDTVLNSALADIKSWGDIHAACGTGRIVAISDTAGHPRYRRTTVRGLVSLKPHWTICCIAADSALTAETHKGSQAVNVRGSVQVVSEHFKAHLELCLTLGLPLIVVITKMDATSVANLRSMLNSILTTLKAAQRQPFVLPSLSQGFSEPGSPQVLTLHDIAEASRVLASGSPSPRTLVPIILTSAVTGRGIGTLHALLRQLPILRSDDTGSLPINGHTPSVGQTVFNIDEVFGASNADAITLHDGRQTLEGYIICGHLSEGPLLVGDELVLGPFSVDTVAKASRREAGSDSSCAGPVVGPHKNRGLISPPVETSRDPNDADHTPFWCAVRIVSLRDLRQPVQRLEADHCGTAGVVLANPSLHVEISKIRKGMVMTSVRQFLTRHEPPAYRGFVASFAAQHVSRLTIGVSVTVYISSIRALAIVTSIGPLATTQRSEYLSFSNDGISNTREPSNLHTTPSPGSVHVGFTFVNSYEFFRRNDQVLIMPDKVESGVTGLGGIIGRISETLQ